MRLLSSIGVTIVLGASVPALAQSAVDPANKNAWAENIGWTNWRDADSQTRGVRLFDTYLSGWIWGENVGWITVGNGFPVGGVNYANVNGTDCGVNMSPVTGNLSGYAWGENIGWVNFSGGALAAPANAARFDPAARRLRGYAWGENVGWFNLDHATAYVGILCPADINADGFVDGIDYDTFNNWFEDGDPAVQIQADYNGDGFVDGIDYDLFNADFEAGC